MKKRVSLISVVVLSLGIAMYVSAATTPPPNLSTILDTEKELTVRQNEYTVDKTGMYEIEIWGGGGNNTSSRCHLGYDAHGGNGAYIKCRVLLTEGDIINFHCIGGSAQAWKTTASYGLYWEHEGDEEPSGSENSAGDNGFSAHIKVNGVDLCNAEGGKTAKGWCHTNSNDGEKCGEGGVATWHNVANSWLLDSMDGASCSRSGSHTSGKKAAVYEGGSMYRGVAKVVVKRSAYNLLYDKGLTNN